MQEVMAEIFSTVASLAVGGRPDLPALNQLLQTLTSASFIAAAGFILRAQLAQTTAQTAYIAMMGDVELPVNTDTVQQPSLKEGSDDDDEQMV